MSKYGRPHVLIECTCFNEYMHAPSSIQIERAVQVEDGITWLNAYIIIIHLCTCTW